MRGPYTDLANEMLLSVSYIDAYGRRVGYDFAHIIAEIRRTYPEAKPSKKWLSSLATALNRSQPLPIRLRSRRRLAIGYARCLAKSRPQANPDSVIQEVALKFPDQPVSRRQIFALRRST